MPYIPYMGYLYATVCPNYPVWDIYMPYIPYMGYLYATVCPIYPIWDTYMPYIPYMGYLYATIRDAYMPLYALNTVYGIPICHYMP